MSLDDFYLLGSGLMMTQTTNNVFNHSLYDSVTPSSLFAWQRVRLAHALAHSGQEWAEIFSRFNSGQKTHANTHTHRVRGTWGVLCSPVRYCSCTDTPVDGKGKRDRKTDKGK